MTTRITLFGALVLGIISFSALGCSSNSTAASPPTLEDAGDAGNSDTGSAVQTCQPACATVMSCYSTLDVNACEAQCSKELAGEGFLIPEVAKKYFQYLKEAKTDPKCQVTLFQNWNPDGQSTEAFLKQFEDPQLIVDCAKATSKCSGFSGQEFGCFISYYRYNVQYRDKLKTCLPHVGSADECAIQDDCLCDNQIEGQPWIAFGRIPFDPNDPGQQCPPLK